MEVSPIIRFYFDLKSFYFFFQRQGYGFGRPSSGFENNPGFSVCNFILQSLRSFQ